MKPTRAAEQAQSAVRQDIRRKIARGSGCRGSPEEHTRFYVKWSDAHLRRMQVTFVGKQ
jgi:hypothetical protein